MSERTKAGTKLRGRLRIISGKWRRREIRFISDHGVRPTTDAARETLFNWLQLRIEGASCLDLFAGSGALGFEALSRGASFVNFVDSNLKCVQQLKRNASVLSADNCSILHAKAEDFLRDSNQRFDVVFIDPPYHQGMVMSSISLLYSAQRLNPGALIYVEGENELNLGEQPDGWKTIRQHQAKSRAHFLFQAP